MRRRPLLFVALAVLALAGGGQAAFGRDPAQLLATARDDLARHDGIAAEIRLKQLIASGASRRDVAALMGAAMLEQKDLRGAREWLQSGDFMPRDALFGFRMLARLEQEAGNLTAAGIAYDRAKSIAPNDPVLWVEIGRLRYAGQEHLKAIEAADHALELAPRNVRALEFRGQLIRDRQGLVAALPWFEAALREAPDDLSVLGEYAATLGELDRAKDMLRVTRRMLELDGHNARAFYLQAVLAARAGDTRLARALLNRTGEGLRDMPAAMLLEGALELRAGNYNLAIDALERLAGMQPANGRARLLLARAYDAAGQHKYLVRRFAAGADRPDAPAYLLLMLGRAYENLGQRDLAAPLLDRAAAMRWLDVMPVAEGSQIGGLLAAGSLDDALAVASRNLATNDASADFQLQMADVLLARGDAAGASEHYRLMARVRLPEPILPRIVLALDKAGRGGDAAGLVAFYLAENPSSPVGAYLAAGLAAGRQDWKRQVLLLSYLKGQGGDRDAGLLSELAQAQIRAGDAKGGLANARQAYRLQRSGILATGAYAAALKANGGEPALARRLADKLGRLQGG